MKTTKNSNSDNPPIVIPREETNFLSEVAKGISLDKKQKVLISGVGGIGKTTFACDAPNPLFICLEDGLTMNDHIDRFYPKKFSDILDLIREIYKSAKTGKFKHETIVFDSIDWLDAMIQVEVLNDEKIQEKYYNSIDDMEFGRGYGAVREYVKKLLESLSFLLRRVDLHIIFIAHIQEKKKDTIDGKAYSVYSLRGNEKFNQLFIDWVDYHLFASYDTSILNDKYWKQKYKMDKPMVRICYTIHTIYYTAKARGNFPAIIPLSWDVFLKEVNKVKQQKREAHPIHVDYEASNLKDLEDLDKVRSSLSTGDVIDNTQPIE